MRPYFHMSDLEPATKDHAKLFAESYLPVRHRGTYLERFTEGSASERLELEQHDRLKWDAMMMRHLQEEVEEQLNGVH